MDCLQVTIRIHYILMYETCHFASHCFKYENKCETKFSVLNQESEITLVVTILSRFIPMVNGFDLKKISMCSIEKMYGLKTVILMCIEIEGN